ncbi:hypothetical protein [Streptomyces sp. NPDC016626]|uniref:hypothetical protein n=1 Tax=Streptomyces sp. NPDC016626 TaxID=3364968 RepID=UPI0036F8F87E
MALRVRRRRKQMGTRRRKAAPGTQAIVVPAVLRHGRRLTDRAGGNSVSAATVRRRVLEVLELLAARAAARAPRPDRALTKAGRNAHHATMLLRALLVPANCEVQRWQTVTRRRSLRLPARGPHHGLTPVPRPASSR